MAPCNELACGILDPNKRKYKSRYYHADPKNTSGIVTNQFRIAWFQRILAEDTSRNS